MKSIKPYEEDLKDIKHMVFMKGVYTYQDASDMLDQFCSSKMKMAIMMKTPSDKKFSPDEFFIYITVPWLASHDWDFIKTKEAREWTVSQLKKLL